MREADDIRNSITEFWRAVLIALLAFAAMVIYIFASSALEWKHEQERLELIAKQKVAEKVGKVSVYAFVNQWDFDEPTKQERVLLNLVVGKEYEIGRLRYYDVNDEETNALGFDHVREEASDSPDYLNPVVTAQYSKFIHVKYSIDNGSGWLISGPTRKGIKTDEWLYTLPEEDQRDTSDSGEGWGEKSLTFSLPINGLDGVEVNIDSADISEEMRGYNYIVTERLGDAYGNVPEEYADRTRKVYTSHVIIEGWRTDPREWKTNGNTKALTPTPEITVLVRIRHYGEWDLTKDEYESMRYKVNEFSSTRFYHDYSKHTTITYVGMLGAEEKTPE